jgi:hypothetical protein
MVDMELRNEANLETGRPVRPNASPTTMRIRQTGGLLGRGLPTWLDSKGSADRSARA